MKKVLFYFFIIGFFFVDNMLFAALATNNMAADTGTSSNYVTKYRYATTRGPVELKVSPGGANDDGGKLDVDGSEGKLQVTGVSGKWIKILYKKITGWIYESNLTYDRSGGSVRLTDTQSKTTQANRVANSKSLNKKNGTINGKTRTTGGTTGGTTGRTTGGTTGRTTGGTTGRTTGGTTGGNTGGNTGGTTGGNTGGNSGNVGDIDLPSFGENNDDSDNGNMDFGGGDDDFNPYPYPLSVEMQRVEARDFYRSMVNTRPTSSPSKKYDIYR